MKQKIDETQWSYFSSDYSTLNITNQNTPHVWNNYIYDKTGRFYALVSQKGHGKVSYNYEQNLVSEGRDYFLRSGDQIWSLNGAAAPCKAEKSLCKMIPGKSVFEVENCKISTKLSVTIDPNSFTEVNMLEIQNNSKNACALDLTAVMHTLLLGEDNTQQLDSNYFSVESNAVIMRRYHSESAQNKYASFFCADYQASSWCGSRLDFIGADKLFCEADSLFDDELNNGAACALADPLSALRFHLSLKSGESVTIHLAMGICDTEEEALKQAATWRNPLKIQKAFANNSRFYKNLLKGNLIQTPDPRINAALNIWTKLQLTHQNLSGRDGKSYNWRNNLQDSMGFLHINAEYLRSRLIGMAPHTFKDGFVPRITLKIDGNKKSTAHKLRHNDIGCWYAIAASYYIRETGDLSVLNEKIYNNDREKIITVGQAIFDGLMWTLSNRGINGLIRFVDGDWSDPLEKAGRRGIGESVWTAMAVVLACKSYMPILLEMGENQQAERLLNGAEDVAASIIKNAWDGKYFVRGITDDGVKFCKSDDPDAQISMLVQAWSVLAEVGSIEQRSSAMNEVKKRCATEFGPMLYGPPFLTEREGIGRESAKRPGCGENGSCYTHGAMMYASALIKHGKSDEALEVMQKVMFPMVPDNYQIRCGSPLWWANYMQAPVAAHPGRSSNIISSGAPAWFYLNILDGFCGIKPTLQGLVISPALPSCWDEVFVERSWRGATYKFSIKRTAKYLLKLDNQELKNNIIPIPTEKKTYNVLVEF